MLFSKVVHNIVDIYELLMGYNVKYSRYKDLLERKGKYS